MLLIMAAATVFVSLSLVFVLRFSVVFPTLVTSPLMVRQISMMPCPIVLVPWWVQLLQLNSVVLVVTKCFVQFCSVSVL